MKIQETVARAFDREQHFTDEVTTLGFHDVSRGHLGVWYFKVCEPAISHAKRVAEGKNAILIDWAFYFLNCLAVPVLFYFI